MQNKETLIKFLKDLLKEKDAVVRVDSSYFDYAGWYIFKPDSDNVIYDTVTGYTKVVSYDDIPVDVIKQAIGILYF